MGVLPLGTLNHFARDLGIPTDLEEAVRVVVEGTVREVDVGEANGRVFVNNSSIGLYPDAVSLRDAWMERDSMHKWVAMGRAALEHAAPVPGGARHAAPARRRRERDDADGLHRQQPLRDEALQPRQARRRSTSGELWVYLARDAGPVRLRAPRPARAGRPPGPEPRFPGPVR